MKHMQPEFTVPAIDGIITADQVRSTGQTIADLQLPTGQVPWFPGGHCDPWNHVETAMALDVVGLHTEAAAAYGWLRDMQLPDGSWYPGVADRQGGAIADLQLPTGQVPWFPGGHCDPWNHVETAMALDVVGLHTEAAAAYGWLRDMQLPDGSWYQYYLGNDVEQEKFDANTIAYIAVGVWHHWLLTGDRAFLTEYWPVVDTASQLGAGTATGLTGDIVWARHADGTAFSFSLLTGSSSISHSLKAAIAIADELGHDPTNLAPGNRCALCMYSRQRGSVRAQETLGHGLVLPGDDWGGPRSGRHRPASGGRRQVHHRGRWRALCCGPGLGHVGRNLRGRAGVSRGRRDRPSPRVVRLVTVQS